MRNSRIFTAICAAFVFGASILASAVSAEAAVIYADSSVEQGPGVSSEGTGSSGSIDATSGSAASAATSSGSGSYAVVTSEGSSYYTYSGSRGWRKQDDGSWTLSVGGVLVTDGWYLDGSYYYLFDASGRMLTGWQTVGGKEYYLAEFSFAGHPEGSCFINEVTPDGCMVDATGAKVSGPVYANIPIHPNPYGDQSCVEIDITNQAVYVYDGFRLVLYCPCVSGWTTAGRSTPLGDFSIYTKERGRTLRGYKSDGTLSYASYVNYWMPFKGAVGLHDATWRSKFGGNIYTYDGSHGCVNLPMASAAQMYGIVYVGMPVHVHL